jgi:hypothetical protein
MLQLGRVTNERETLMKSILDRKFRYTPSVNTDLRKTFARVRREQHANERAVEPRNKVLPMRRNERASAES